MASRPSDLSDLFCFYYDKFKPLYGEVEAEGNVTNEMLFEVAAAFDHLARLWKFHEPEKQVVDRACGHLKRGCFDAFKLAVVRVSDMRKRLSVIETSLIDNGNFDREMIEAWHRIREGAKEARLAEGDALDD